MNPIKILLIFTAVMLFFLAGCTSTNSGNSGKIQNMNILKQETIPELNLKNNPRYGDFAEISKPGFIIPGLKQNAVPQGIGYIESLDWIIISHYLSDGRSSCLTAVDIQTGKLVKTLWLLDQNGNTFTGHVGGVCASLKHIWVASGSGLHSLLISDFIKAADNSSLKFKEYFETETRASFASYSYSDNVVWVGEFAYYPNSGRRYETKKPHHLKNRDGKLVHGWALGYKLDPETDSLRKTQAPDYILSIPDKVQGLAFFNNFLALSTSYGRNNNSILYIHKNPLTSKPDKYEQLNGSSTVPLWFIDSENAVSKLVCPSMMEGIVLYKNKDENKLILLFESGAEKYRATGIWPVDKTYYIDTSKLK